MTTQTTSTPNIDWSAATAIMVMLGGSVIISGLYGVVGSLLVGLLAGALLGAGVVLWYVRRKATRRWAGPSLDDAPMVFAESGQKKPLSYNDVRPKVQSDDQMVKPVVNDW
jgi:hypothetical protein